jgi:hypothetical protein
LIRSLLFSGIDVLPFNVLQQNLHYCKAMSVP